VDTFFKISERGSTIGREVRGGVVTFFTMAYIIVLNPIILLGAKDHSGHVLGSFTAIAAGTALVAGIMSIVMGLVANFPLAIATGLGLNAFLTFSVASKMTWADAMGLVVLEGLIILILVLTGFRKAVFSAVPPQLKISISVGIGLFIALIGFSDAGFVSAGSGTTVQLGRVGNHLSGWPVFVFIVGLALVTVLWVMRIKGAILISIVLTTILAIIVQAIGKQGPLIDAAGKVHPGGWGLNVPKWPDKIASTPELHTFWHFNLFGSFQSAGVITAILLLFTLVLSDFFDLLGTMTAVGAEADLLDEEGIPPNSQRILIVDALAASAGGVGGVSSNTAFIESASGVGEGARTGLAPIVTGILFLLAMPFAAVVNVIPSEAAVPALILVGFLMMQQVKGIDWDDLEIAIPAFLTIALMPFTYSITVGIGAGFISFALIKLVRGKAKEVHLLMWVIALLFVVFFAIDPITSWLT